MNALTPEALILAVSAIGGTICMLVGFGVSKAQGKALEKAIEGIARQPEAKGDITSTMIVGLAMIETSEIFAFVIAVILIIANPLIGKL